MNKMPQTTWNYKKNLPNIIAKNEAGSIEIHFVDMEINKNGCKRKTRKHQKQTAMKTRLWRRKRETPLKTGEINELYITNTNLKKNQYCK